MNLSRFEPEVAATPDEPRPRAWPSWWWTRLELSPNTHRSFGHEAPLTRGWLHLAAALVWPFFVSVLVSHGSTTYERVGALAFGLAMETMFSVSAVTHLRRWGVWVTEVLFRLDHVGIFIAIAGSITPFALIVLDGWARWLVLVLAWLTAIGGATAILWPKRTPLGFGNTAFITFGAMVVPFLPLAWDRLGPGGIAYLLGGGSFYIVGAILLAFQRPRLHPEWFGYHEVWHVMVVLGVASHWLLVDRYYLPLS